MRTVRVLLIGLSIGIGSLLFGCQEEEVAVAPDRDLPIDAKVIYLAPGEEYFHAFEAIPFEGGFLITEAPRQAVVSEFTFRDGKYGYLYQPRSGFVGNDWVTLAMCVSIGGPECEPGPGTTLGIVIGSDKK